MGNAILKPEEVKHELLNILIKFDFLTKEYGLTYSLAYGTLLGAVRHKGFIPWDDDIDVLIPRPDYDRLVVEFTGDADCALLSSGTGYPWNFSKLVSLRTSFVEEGLVMPERMGVFVDVFPVDGLPAEGYDARVSGLGPTTRLAGVVFALDYGCEANRGGFKNVLRRAVSKVGKRFLSQDALACKIQDICRGNTFESSDKVGVFFGAYGAPQEEYPRSMFEGCSEVAFSGRKLKTFADPECYLAHMYGEGWRIPTPQSPRIHGRAYMLEGGDARLGVLSPMARSTFFITGISTCCSGRRLSVIILWWGFRPMSSTGTRSGLMCASIISTRLLWAMTGRESSTFPQGRRRRGRVPSEDTGDLHYADQKGFETIGRIVYAPVLRGKEVCDDQGHR